MGGLGVHSARKRLASTLEIPVLNDRFQTGSHRFARRSIRVISRLPDHRAFPDLAVCLPV